MFAPMESAASTHCAPTVRLANHSQGVTISQTRSAIVSARRYIRLLSIGSYAILVSPLAELPTPPHHLTTSPPAKQLPQPPRDDLFLPRLQRLRIHEDAVRARAGDGNRGITFHQQTRYVAAGEA